MRPKSTQQQLEHLIDSYFQNNLDDMYAQSTTVRKIRPKHNRINDIPKFLSQNTEEATSAGAMRKIELTYWKGSYYERQTT